MAAEQDVRWARKRAKCVEGHLNKADDPNGAYGDPQRSGHVLIANPAEGNGRGKDHDHNDAREQF